MKSTLFVILFSVFFLSGTYLMASDKEPKSSPAKLSSISGVISDYDTNEKLAGVTISFVDSGKKIYTNVQGDFTIEGLAPGTYKIKINCISYKDKEVTVEVSPLMEKNLKIQLSPVEP